LKKNIFSLKAVRFHSTRDPLQQIAECTKFHQESYLSCA